MSLLDSIHVFVVVPLTQNFPPLEMERSKGVYYHPYFLTFTWNLSLQLHRQPIGCSVGDTVVNHMLYADELVLFAPSATGLQKLLDLSHTYGCNHYMEFNPSKSSVMYIDSRKAGNAQSMIIGGKMLNVIRVYIFLISWTYYM